MKNLITLFILFCLLAFLTGCDEKEEETINPIIGTWQMESELELYMAGYYYITDKWTFEISDSGCYRNIVNGSLVIQDTFSWSQTDSIYSIDYFSDELEDIQIKIRVYENQPALLSADGYSILAYKIEE